MALPSASIGINLQMGKAWNNRCYTKY